MIRTSGAMIYYEIRGSVGPPVVLIRGYGSSMHTWNGVDHDLARDHCTVVLDNRGSGQSSAPTGRYQVAEMARDVVAVMRHAGLNTAHVLGTSLGGMIAQELAIRFPNRVKSLVLVATTPGSHDGMPITTRGMLLLAAAALMPPHWRARLAARATLSPPNRHKIGSECRTVALRRKRQTGSLAGLIGQASAIFGHRAANRLAQISVPTLVVHGTADELIDPRNGGCLANLIPGARLEPWSGAGHDLATEDPCRLADCVRRHIREFHTITEQAREPSL